MITFIQILLYLGLLLLCLFMILIILLQRGKGGGLVGAFGGLGGNSAFGAKTGDVFLKITIVTAFFWFVLCFGGRYLLNAHRGTSLVSGVRTPVEATTPPAEGAVPGENAAQTGEVPAPAAPTNDAVPAGDAAPVAPAPAAPTNDAAPAGDAAPAQSVPAN